MNLTISAIIWFSLGALAGFYVWYFFSGLKIFERFLEKVTKRDAEKIAEFRAMAQREFELAAKAKGEAESLLFKSRFDLVEYNQKTIKNLENAYWRAYEDYRVDLENGVPFDPTLFSDAIKALREQQKTSFDGFKAPV